VEPPELPVVELLVELPEPPLPEVPLPEPAVPVAPAALIVRTMLDFTATTAVPESVCVPGLNDKTLGEH